MQANITADRGLASRPPALPISAYVICKNEEAHIARCLRSLAICKEIIVVDSGSTDHTVSIIQDLAASGLPIKFSHQDWLGYAAQKQVALEQASEPWCLNLDADETLDAALQNELAVLVAAEDRVGGWRLRRIPTSVFGVGPLPAGIYPKPVLRLVRRGRARYDLTTLVHEHIFIEGEIRTSRRGLIEHARPLRLQEQLQKELVYARLKAMQRRNHGKRPSLLKLLFNPPLYFIRLFFLHRWFLCGRLGFVHAMTGAIYAFTVEALQFELARQVRNDEQRP